MRALEEGKDWTRHGHLIKGRGAAVAIFRGLQADLNSFGEARPSGRVMVDGELGPDTVVAFRSVYQAVVSVDPGLARSVVAPVELEEAAIHAMTVRDWIQRTARPALGVDVRRYLRGAGKDWELNAEIACGIGWVHEDFAGLQRDLNRFAVVCGFLPLEVNGRVGPDTARAVTLLYDRVVARHPRLGATPFPPAGTTEETAEYCMFIRGWLETTAAGALLPVPWS